MNREIENRVYDLIGLKLAGNMTPAELAELDKIIKDNPEISSFCAELENSVLPISYTNEILEQAYASHYVKYKLLQGNESNEITQPPPKKVNFIRNPKYIAVAASLLFIIVFFYVYLANDIDHAFDSGIKNEVASQKGSKSKIVLPDGTNVVLNSDSRISYTNLFNQSKREIFLTGEAYFDVKYDDKKPFIICTGDVRIKVLGTEFNVRNYPQEDFIETSLIRGSIELTSVMQEGSKFVLKPSEKMLISKTGLASVDANVSAAVPKDIFKLTHIAIDEKQISEIAWLDNKISFTNKSLHEIAKELERRFNLTVIFENDSVKEYRYTIHARNYKPEEIMELMKLSRNINYTFVKDTLIIK